MISAFTKGSDFTKPSDKKLLLRIGTVLLILLCVYFLMQMNQQGELSDNNSLNIVPAVTNTSTDSGTASYSYDDIPPLSAYDGTHAYVVVHNNEPYFTAADKTRTDAFETYAELDSLGRCGTAYANICLDLMPTEARDNIGSVKPTGWHSTKYDIVDGKYLYNRCHLIGYQLSGENANKQNLITGTRYLNINGMLSSENTVADFVKDTEYHVLYRVTPIFRDDNLIADGVLMEAWSVEDEGEGICFCIYAFNVQPGVTIDYATGDSQLSN